VLVETAYQGATLDFLFELGIEVEDSVTGYKGHITARVQHITGCNTYHVQRKFKPKEEIKYPESFDENRLVPTGKRLKLPTYSPPAIVKPGADHRVISLKK
jgi:hypothetical protein